MTSRPYHSKRQFNQTPKRTINRHSTKEYSMSNHSNNPSKYKSRHSKASSNIADASNSKKRNPRRSALRRKQRDINYQYKLYSLREIIQKITTKSSIISTNTAKETLITYYQTFTSSQELLDELQHRFFSVLPTEEEDKSARPYISDTDSVSERHFKFGSNSYRDRPYSYHILHNNKKIPMDENKAYCIQVRVVNLLTFWMKEYFMEDFNDVNMLQQLKNFIYKIRCLKQKQKLPSIPFDDTPSNIPSIPSINDDDNNIYNKLINHKSHMTINRLGTNYGISPINNQFNTQNNIIKSYHHNNNNKNNSSSSNNNNNEKGFIVNRNPLHSSNISNINQSIISDGQNSQNSNSMKTEQIKQIGNKILPIHQNSNGNDINDNKNNKNNTINIVRLNINKNTIYIPHEELCFYDNKLYINSDINSDLFYIINGIDNIKVGIKNVCDYNNMHNRYNNHKKRKKIAQEKKIQSPLQLHESPKVFTRQKNINLSKPFDDSDVKESKESKESKELTENIISTPITSSTEPREHSIIEDSRLTVDDQIFMDKVKVKDNIIRRVWVTDPSKYKSLSDKIEKTLNKQKKEAPKNREYITRDISQRCLIDSNSNNNNSSHKQKQTPVGTMAQIGCSIRGAAKIREMFWDEIQPLKENFQNKVKNKVIAEQITLMTFNAFKRVRKREFIDQSWKCKDRLELAGNLCQLIDHFNCISRWVQITILHCKDVKKRARMIKKFIKIMDILLELNNFQSLCAVYGAITSSSVYSLENAWNNVPNKHKERFEHIKHYFVTANNMANLRTLHIERNPPMIPYTGIYLQDLIQTEERFKDRMMREQMKSNNSFDDKYDLLNTTTIKYDFTGSGGVVFDHLTKMSKQIDKILIYAKTPYHNIKDDQITQKYILSEFADQANFTDDQIYKLSETVAKADAQ